MSREVNPDIIAEINRLRTERNAIILSHNYQRPEVQDIADFVGDSLELSIKASKVTDVDVIVFCSVHFMAETAKLLSPGKTVLLPEKGAGCPMSDMVEPEPLRALKAQHPGVPVVCYVNTSAAVKAECEISCTSANAAKVVNSLPDEEIIFVPDRNLGAWVQTQTEKKLILWPGYCPTHDRVLTDHVLAAKAEHPEALTMVHPECSPEVTALADYVLSTGGMLRMAHESPATAFIMVTEEGLQHRLRKENPEKAFYLIRPTMVCPNMKKTTIEKVLWSLQDMQYQVEIPDEIAGKARQCIQRMLDVI